MNLELSNIVNILGIIDKLKKLLILGANPETAHLVKKANLMGVYTIVTDNLKYSPAKKCANEAQYIDGTDVDGIVSFVKANNIDGVLLGTADPLVQSYFKICKKLNFPCYVTKDSVDVFSDKEKLKLICKKFGVESVPQYSLEDINNNNVIFPIVVKPVDGRSGKGITVCYNKNEIEAAILKAKKFSSSGEVLFERYMSCDDVFFYYTFKNGTMVLSAMADRYTTKEQVGFAPVVLGAKYPSKYLNLYLNSLHKNMCKMFCSLGIIDGILLIQAFVENDNFYVYDPGFRFQGGAPHILIEKVNGLDQEKMMINFALGLHDSQNILEVNDPCFKNKVVGSQVILLKAGKIKKIIGLDKISSLKEVCNITQRLFEGDVVTIIGSEQQVLARVHIVANDLDSFKNTVSIINKEVVAFDEFGNVMNLKGLEIE